jgi:hypothetical protein
VFEMVSVFGGGGVMVSGTGVLVFSPKSVENGSSPPGEFFSALLLHR